MDAKRKDVPTIDSAELKELTEKLITSCHILDNEGVTDGYGHVGVRVPGREAFITPIIPIDLGIVYGEAPNTNIKMTGYEIKWAVLKGGVATPAIAPRGAYTQLSGVSDFDISTTSADISISKGFAIFTPYAGYGMVWIDSKDNRPVKLQDESLDESKWFVGFRLTFFPFMNMVAEADFAQVNAYSLRLNVHF